MATDAGGVTVVIDPADYSRELAQMDQGSSTSYALRLKLAGSTTIPPPTTAPSPPT